jgi:hypothetical protein
VITGSVTDGSGAVLTGAQITVNLYLQPQSFFPTQTIDSLGNANRYNPKMRYWPGLNENISVTREFSLKEKAHLEFRLEGFNVLNRVAFGPLGGATTLTNANWGQVAVPIEYATPHAVGGETDLVVVCEGCARAVRAASLHASFGQESPFLAQ